MFLFSYIKKSANQEEQLKYATSCFFSRFKPCKLDPRHFVTFRCFSSNAALALGLVAKAHGIKKTDPASKLACQSFHSICMACKF